MDSNTLPGHQLYYFASCPFCIKTLVAMKWMGIKLPLKNIKREPAIREELIAGGGKKQVPCLRIEDTDGVQWMYESSDIIRYLKNAISEN
ncbi:MAG: glutaredoxin [Gammaproteobacteria bacterium]|nr:glutathione S-transferase N-terminal domain-containing protein [Gammaproteobacteria bacterium]NNC97200.1 glutaredoxin [Gammaproteobacteria bacterium]NNM14490.1 glutaredoxin [Gammaproteobacteria bacterium]